MCLAKIARRAGGPPVSAVHSLMMTMKRQHVLAERHSAMGTPGRKFTPVRLPSSRYVIGCPARAESEFSIQCAQARWVVESYTSLNRYCGTHTWSGPMVVGAAVPNTGPVMTYTSPLARQTYFRVDFSIPAQLFLLFCGAWGTILASEKLCAMAVALGIISSGRHVPRS